MKKVLTICSVLLVLASLAAFAEDNRGVVVINGGKMTVAMKGSAQSRKAIKAPSNPFYDNIGTTGYDSGEGWTISDGSPIDTEYTLAGQITSLKSGTTKKVSVGLGFVEGTNGAILDIDKDCSNMPCGNPDGSKHLCQVKLSNLPNFGSTGTTVVSGKCKANFKKNKLYWVYIQSLANSWLAWNINATGATGGQIEGTNDVWGTYQSGASEGALTIK
jgi:hypothetical protein